MAKTKISEFSSTPANNTDIDSINISEGCAPSGINDAIRELMAQLKDFQTGAVGDSFNGPIGTSTAAAGAFTTLSASGAITSTLATGTAPLVIASTTKVANLNVDSLDGADWASPAALGSTTPAAVSATTLSASGNVTLSGGTANGVAYLNGSKVVTSGSALVFDGTNLGIGTSSPAYKLQVIGASQIQTNAAGTQQVLQLNNSDTTAGTQAVKLGFSSAGSTKASINAAVYGNDYMTFNVGSDTERMRIDSSGNLGIGTSSPSQKLDVVGSVQIQNSGTLYLNNSDNTNQYYWQNIGSTGANNATLILSRTNAGETLRIGSSGNLGLGVTPSAWSLGKAIEVNNAGNALWGVAASEIDVSQNAYYNSGWKYASSSYASRYEQNTGVHKWWNAPSGTAGNAITFTQAMTLEASGNLLVGTTSATAKFTVESSSLVARFTQTSAAGVAQFKNGSDAGYGLDFLNVAGSSVGAIYWTGTATTYATSSDYRLKNTIAPMTGALAKVALLKPCTYKWNADGSDGEGFIAHELAEVVPQCVTGEKDGVNEDGTPKYQGIDTSFLVATLTAAIQEQQAIINSLKARLDAANL